MHRARQKGVEYADANLKVQRTNTTWAEKAAEIRPLRSPLNTEHTQQLHAINTALGGSRQHALLRQYNATKTQCDDQTAPTRLESHTVQIDAWQSNKLHLITQHIQSESVSPAASISNGKERANRMAAHRISRGNSHFAVRPNYLLNVSPNLPSILQQPILHTSIAQLEAEPLDGVETKH